MSKTIDTGNFPAILPSPDNETDSDSVSIYTDTAITFPCSQRKAADALSTSPMTVGRWIKQLKEVGVVCMRSGKVTESGFEELTKLKNSGFSPSEYCAQLSPSVEVLGDEVSTSALAIPESHRSQLAAITSRALARQANLKAEFFELLNIEEEAKSFDAEVSEMRMQKIAQRAYEEFVQEEKLKLQIKQELRKAKLQRELGGTE